jgi:hypothetical protein
MSAAPHQLLCESCGYPLDGIDQSGSCPECGMPIAESLPDRRPGSPWQQRPGVKPLLATQLGMLLHPRAAWSTIRPVAHRALSLFGANLAIAVILGTLALIPAGAAKPRYIFIYAVGFFLLLLSLTAVEYSGIRILGKRHGFRTTPGVALAVCAHASVGWIISGAAIALGAIAARCLTPSRLVGGGVILIGGFLCGMIIFSVLCGIGYRALRYANA